MPENKSESAIIPDGMIPDGEAVPEAAGAEAAQAENAWVAFERGRLSRRQALKKLGMTSAMATFALFSVDDLARMVGKAMQQRAADNKVVEQVAKELQQAGIALADVSPACSACEQHYQNCIVCGCNVNHPNSGAGRDACYQAQGDALSACLSKNCPGGSTGSPPPSAVCGSFNANYCAVSDNA